MMAFFLNRRASHLPEKMEDPNCDLHLLYNTYRQFEMINKLLSGWKKLYQDHIRPVLEIQGQATLLDIGFGGGDLPIRLHKWALEDNFKLDITAIETDQRALDFVRKERTNIPAAVDFQFTSIEQLLPIEDPFDFVISNHLLHHLSGDELQTFANRCERLVKRKIIFNDLQRHPAAYMLFSAFVAPFFWQSFAAADGRRSIRKSYTKNELRELLPHGWEVQRQFPFRLIASYVRQS